MRKTRLHDPAEPPPPRRFLRISGASRAAERTPSSDTPRGTSGASGGSGGSGSRSHAAHAARGRRARVRNRLLAGVLLTGIAVLAAGAPAVESGYRQLRAGQRGVDDATLAQRALTLTHTLAEERNAFVIAAAGDDPVAAAAAALSDEDRAHADQQLAALAPEVPASVRDSLETVPDIRERAEGGQADPRGIHAAYTRVVEGLGTLVLMVTAPAPGKEADPTAAALPELARAVDAAAASRGLLVAALSAEGEQRPLATLAQRERAREEAALHDFTAVAAPDARRAYRETVAGPDVEAAEEYLAELTGQSHLTPEGQALDRREVSEALSARTGLQRAVLTSLTAEHVQRLKGHHTEHVASLLLRVGLLLAALVLAIGVSVRTARSLTRPLAAVRLGSRRVAADPEGQQPVRYNGRDDEFAEVVASVNALHARAVELHQEAAETQRDTGGLRAERDRLLAEQRELSQRLTALHGAVHGMFAHHAQRLLALVREQLTVIEGLEEHETDPDHLAVLFALDHLAARMRRHGENLLLLAGAGPAGRSGSPLPLIDVLRAAVSEIERYELVEISPPPPARVTGPAARDLSHLLAELLDNATAFSPQGSRVRLSGRWLEGGLTLQVADEGAGLPPERLAALNARMADPVTPPPGAVGGHAGQPGATGEAGGIGMGLYTVARLAARHGLRAALRQRPGGGTFAEVTVPAALLTQAEELGPMGDTGALTALLTTGPIPHVTHVTGPQPVVPTPRGSARTEIPDMTDSMGIPVVPGPSDTGGVPRYPGAGEAPGSHDQPPEHARAADSAPHGHAVTDSGLPRRTAGATGPPPGRSAAPAGPQPTPSAGVDAQELRRRLGGFQRGAREGHRDAARAVGEPGAASDTPVGGTPRIPDVIESAQRHGSFAAPDSLTSYTNPATPTNTGDTGEEVPPS